MARGERTGFGKKAAQKALDARSERREVKHGSEGDSSPGRLDGMHRV